MESLADKRISALMKLNHKLTFVELLFGLNECVVSHLCDCTAHLFGNEHGIRPNMDETCLSSYCTPKNDFLKCNTCRHYSA